MRQGDIFLVNLNPTKGHEQAGFRPVLVMQNDILNSALNTVIVAPITSNLEAKGRITTYFLPKQLSRLNKDSIVLLFQLRVLDARRLRRKIANLGKKEFFKIKRQLAFVF